MRFLIGFVVFLCSVAFNPALAMEDRYTVVEPTFENGGSQLQRGLAALGAENYIQAERDCLEAENKLRWYTPMNNSYGYDYAEGYGPWLKKARQCVADANAKMGNAGAACSYYKDVGYESTGGTDMTEMCSQYERIKKRQADNEVNVFKEINQLNRLGNAAVAQLTSGQNAESQIAEYEGLCGKLGNNSSIADDFREGLYSFCRGQASFYRGDVDTGCRYFRQSVEAFKRITHGRDYFGQADSPYSELGQEMLDNAQAYVSGC